MTNEIMWHSMSKDLKVVAREKIDVKKAILIAKEYYSRAGKKYDNGEEAVVGTIFGFRKNENDFIVICINDVNSIRITRDKEIKRKSNKLGDKFLPKSKTIETDEEIGSLEELISTVEEYFREE
jgi:hypothetical protein